MTVCGGRKYLLGHRNILKSWIKFTKAFCGFVSEICTSVLPLDNGAAHGSFKDTLGFEFIGVI